MKQTDPGFEEAIAEAIERKLGGESSKDVLVTSHGNLSHSQFELAFWRQVPEAQGGLAEHVGSSPRTGEWAIVWRDLVQVSWGQISILMDCPESQVRSLYKEASGKLSQGKRIGHGGRWYLNERELYVDGLQRPGTEIPKDHEGRSVREQAILSATEQKLIHKDISALRELAKANGLAITNRQTKAQLVKLLLGSEPKAAKRSRKATKK